MDYEGTHKLWLEPGTPVKTGPIAATLDGDVLTWRWEMGEKVYEGMLDMAAARWRDGFHQQDVASIDASGPTFGARFAAAYAYGPPEAPWAWRIRVCDRPSGELVVQMDNITPWGEHAPAVEWVLAKKG